MTVAAAQTEGAVQLHGHSPERERPLGGYLALTGTYVGGCGAFAVWMRATGRELPEQISNRDLLLVAVATHKAARLIAKDRVASTLRAPFTRFQGDAGPGEVDEAARGRGMRRAIGELVTCPFCIGMWISTAFLGALTVAPRPARWAASVLTVLTGADVLQLAYAKAEQQL
ncbi:MAG: DUF1360 domain-containing protein [Solirubrobacteraceae bacterium]